MRLWVLLLVLLCATATLAKAKSKHESEEEDLPPVADGDPKEMEQAGLEPLDEKVKSKLKRGPASRTESEEDGFEGRIEELRENIIASIGIDPESPRKSATKDKTKSNRKSKQEDEIDAEPEEVCDITKTDSACVCESAVVDCNNTMYYTDEKESPMDTAYIVIAKNTTKNFDPKEVILSHNTITSLRKGKIFPGHEEHVTSIRFDHNYIMSIDDGAFADFKKLQVLDLTKNRLKKIRAAMFKGAQSIDKLILEDNPIDQIEAGAFKELKNLKTLVLDGNTKIALKKELFEGLEKLEELSLDRMNIKVLDNDIFENIPNLKQLSLRDNPMNIVPKAIGKLDKLEDLDISLSDISELHMASFKDDHHLKTLRAENMESLYSIDKCTFCKMPSLEHIYFDGSNHLTEFDMDAFGYASGESDSPKSLKTLSLRNTNVSTLHEDTLYWGEETKLYISGVPINCTCETAYLLGGTEFPFEYDNQDPKCGYPKALKGKPLINVQPTEACATYRTYKQASKAALFFSILFVLAIGCLGVFLLHSRGVLQSCIVTAKNVTTFPHMTYSNLNSNEDGRSLEADFQNRPEDV